jgi:hypothetical protein
MIRPIFRPLALLAIAASAFLPQTQAQINENKVVEPFVLPRNLLFAEAGGAARNVALFSYQRIIPLSPSKALTARVGAFGLGNSSEGSAVAAQIDASAGLGVLLSTENQHNVEIEAVYNRFLSREEDVRYRDQNRYALLAGYRLQPPRNGRGFGMRVGIGMLAYTQTDEQFLFQEPSRIEKSMGFFPTGYLGLGYAF